MRLQIAGKTVEVDDSFKSLSPEQQQATVNEIASHIQGSQDKRRQEDANALPPHEPNMLEKIASPIVGTGAALGAGIGMAAASPVGKFLEARSVAGKLGEALRGAVAPEAKASAKVADMASSNAVRDIALQGLQRGVQGVTAAAGAIAPYVRGLSGAALALHSEGLNNGEDQLVQQMHQQQDLDVASGAIAPAGPPPADVPTLDDQSQQQNQGAVAPQGR